MDDHEYISLTQPLSHQNQNLDESQSSLGASSFIQSNELNFETITNDFEYVGIPSEKNITSQFDSEFHENSIDENHESNEIDDNNFTSKRQEFNDYICNEMKKIQLEHNFDETRKTISKYLWQMVQKDKRERQMLLKNPSLFKTLQNFEKTDTIKSENDEKRLKKVIVVKFPKTLKEFGYDFNRQGLLCKIDKSIGLVPFNPEFRISENSTLNKLYYEEFGKMITNYVYELIEKNGLEKMYIPKGIPIDEATFIFCTPSLLNSPKKLLILIQDSGSIRAGQWNKNLIISNSLEHGSQIPYITQAKVLGYDILVTNTNDNCRLKNGKKHLILRSESPLNHAIFIWRNFVVAAGVESIAIIAHGYGGFLTVELARKFPSDFENKVFALGFIDSFHSMYGLSHSTRNILINRGRHYKTSDVPISEISSSKNDIPQYSTGHPKPEFAPYSCMSAILEFIENKYKEYIKNKVS